MSTPAPAPQKTEKGTAYVVLKVIDVDKGWIEVADRVKEPSAAAAVRAVAQTNSGEFGGEGTYVAVPERSWQPVKVTVETTKTVKLG